jgi:uncharacterized delta-60 repeat protein
VAAFLVLSGASLASVCHTQWSETWGAGREEGYGAATDASGNAYMAGQIYNFGLDNWDVFLAKYDSSGNQQWNRTMEGADYDYGYGAATDPSGNIYVAGYTSSFGEGSSDALLLKYDSAGNYQWNRTWGGTNIDEGYGVAADPAGNVYIAGKTNSVDAFIAKYDTDGNQLWNRTWGGIWDDQARGVATDSSGNVYITGQGNSFGIGGTYDAFIVKYNSSGDQQWNRTWGGTEADGARSIATDTSGNIYMAGYTSSFGAEGWDVLLVKYNSSGDQQWNATWGGSGYEQANGAAADPSGNVYVGGYTYSFGAGDLDAFLVKYDSSGNQLWNTTWGGASYDSGYGVTTDSAGNVYMAGYAGSFGSNALLLEYDPSGNQVWNRTWGAVSTWGFDVAIDSSGKIYMSGYGYDLGTGTMDAFLAQFNGSIPGGNGADVGGVSDIGVASAPESPLAVAMIFGLAVLAWAFLIALRR